MNPLPFVSVVIPALNCSNEIAPCVEALRHQDYPGDRFEIIMVDNGSTDGTREAIEEAGVIALERSDRGRSRALNKGIREARGEIICTTDVSCIPEPQWLRTLVDAFRDPSVGCVAGEIRLLKTDGPLNAALGFQERSDYMSPMHAIERTQFPFMPFADGANASFRKALFDEIGPFEESFIKGADVEICYRMFLLSRYKILFHRGAVVWEPGEPNLWALLRQRFRIGIGWNLLRLKYPQLYARRGPARGLQALYWTATDKIGHALETLRADLQAVRGSQREEAIDLNIRRLMGLAQAAGRLYGRWFLAIKGIRPTPIDAEVLEEFIADRKRLAGRILEVPSPHAPSPERARPAA